MNYDKYKLRLLQKLKYFKIPENEYNFNNENTGDCVFVRHDGEYWYVIQSDNHEEITRGIFYGENYAYDFLFYLVMKKYININKRWW